MKGEFLIKGLEGKRVLSGKATVRGAKNASLKAFAASLLFNDEIFIDNAPLIKDIESISDLLRHLGVDVARIGERSFRLKTPSSISSDLTAEIAKSFRASIVLTGPILVREGEVSFPHPGGCVIGARPIDIFLESFQKMGAKVNRVGRKYVIFGKKLHSAEITFKIPSVTATETLIMTAVLVPGRTVLHNVACEPEIVNLIDFLNASGARISGAGSPTIVINGVNSLKGGKHFVTIPDRIETGSFAVLAAVCGKDIEITHCCPDHLNVVLDSLSRAGVNISRGKNSIRIKSSPKLRGINVKTHEYPGLPTDLQPPLAVLLTQASGRSFIFETIFEGRLNYLTELARMGADITICDPHRAVIFGATPLRGREMESPDLRAGLAFVIAALVAKGNSVINNISNIDRGYENIEERLRALGADIERV